MEQIKMVDLNKQYERLKTDIDAAIQEVVDSAAFIQGKQVGEFADSLGKYVGASAVTCGNGTDALQIAMMALRFEPGDEVIVPAFTYVATVEVIALLGLTPVYVDVHEETFNIDVDKLEDVLTSNTVGIVPVDLFGQCAYMEPILEFAERHNLYVIEDAAQALGAEYTFSDGTKKKAGTLGSIGITSFFPSKNLSCFGDGGALFSDNQFLVDKIKMIGNHGQREKYCHDIIGINSRLDTLQAAILNVKINQLDDFTRRRQQVAAFYDRELGELGQVAIPHRAPHSTHVFHQYTLKVTNGNRDEFKKYLASNNIPSMIYYPLPVHLQKAYRREGIGEGSFPVAEKLCHSVISLPVHTEMSEEQLSYICSTIKKYFNG